VNLSAISTSQSRATLDITNLAVGIHSITAVYNGSGLYQTSTSNPFLQQVNAVAAVSTKLPGFALIASYTTQGDTSLPPAATLYAVPATLHAGQSVTLLWSTLNVAQIQITGTNGIDPPFDSGRVTTTGSGAYIVTNGFTATITLTLTAYDQNGAPLGVTSVAKVTIS
jgi:hypothetical protein